MVNHCQETITASDGHEIGVRSWEPAAPTTAIIQVLHGLGEHMDRYDRFAAAAMERGFTVVGHDHRGHGAGASTPGHFADSGGWQKVTEDVCIVNDWIRVRYPEQPVVMLGHSMGAFIAQSFAMYYGARLKGLILSASTWGSRVQLLPLLAIARLESWRLGKRGHSALLAYLGFGRFNQRFKPVRTESDWLTRDEAEVDKYVADPLCGGPFTCRLWLDLAQGLWEISSDESLARIPSDLPILVTGGEEDSLGGDNGMSKLLLHYAQTGHSRVRPKIYPDARHEMLNELNRDDVTTDWLDWISTTTSAGARQQ